MANRRLDWVTSRLFLGSKPFAKKRAPNGWNAFLSIRVKNRNKGVCVSLSVCGGRAEVRVVQAAEKEIASTSRNLFRQAERI